MVPQKIFKIRIFNLAENEFQTTKFHDFLEQVTNLSDLTKHMSILCIATPTGCVNCSDDQLIFSQRSRPFATMNCLTFKVNRFVPKLWAVH